MKKKTSLLDCTLRDGAYVVDGNFGNIAITGIIKKLQDANVDIVECGWLKNAPHQDGSSFYHTPKDLVSYLSEKNEDILYTVMIDWDRYDLENLPQYDGTSIGGIRVVFPHGKHKEGIAVGKEIQKKGYRVLFQAANTLVYTDEDLRTLAQDMNEAHPVALSIVDTFGAMFEKDLVRIANILDECLDPDIRLGFHSHNNQQLSFSLTMRFIELFQTRNRSIIVDSSLTGMGRGAGNTATELLVNYLNREQKGNYDMDIIMEAIDIYMSYFMEHYSWGYSTPYFIAGMYCCHVNNIAYLMKNHRTSMKDMRNIISSLQAEDRRKYDYDLLEEKYLENQNRKIDDEDALALLRKAFSGRKVLLLAPGKSILTEQEKVQGFINAESPIVVAMNAIAPWYKSDYIFLINSVRYNYAKESYPAQFGEQKKILLSNIKTTAADDEIIVNFDRVFKRGWVYFDNAVIAFLRLLNKLRVTDIAIAGFDSFKTKYNETYADQTLPTLNSDNNGEAVNQEIEDMLADFRAATGDSIRIQFVTESRFDF